MKIESNAQKNDAFKMQQSVTDLSGWVILSP